MTTQQAGRGVKPRGRKLQTAVWGYKQGWSPSSWGQLALRDLRCAWLARGTGRVVGRLMGKARKGRTSGSVLPCASQNLELAWRISSDARSRSTSRAGRLSPGQPLAPSCVGFKQFSWWNWKKDEQARSGTEKFSRRLDFSDKKQTKIEFLVALCWIV